MKKLIFASAFTLLSLIGFSQNAKVDKSGNYIAISKTVGKSENKPTGKTFTDSKGKVYPVFVSANGKLYIVRTSKSGNEYKQYLKL